MKCKCLCFGFSEVPGKNNWNKIIGCESLSRGLASGHSSFIIIGFLQILELWCLNIWLICQRYSVTLRFFKIFFKKEVHWWRHLLFWWCHQQIGFWPKNYILVTWASQLLHWSSSFLISPRPLCLHITL